MLKYLILILVVLCGVYAYLNLGKANREVVAIGVGDVILLKVEGRDDLTSVLKRLSSTQVLFTFVKNGDQPQVDVNPESVYVAGSDISVLGGECKLNFRNLKRGRINCLGMKEFAFRSYLQEVEKDQVELVVTEELRERTGAVLAKIEGLSDRILEDRHHIVEGRELVRVIKEGGARGAMNDLNFSPKMGIKNSNNRSGFLRASREGQEISLANRLLDEEAKVILKMHRYSINDIAVPGDLEPLESSGELEGSYVSGNSNSGGQWWKDLD